MLKESKTRQDCCGLKRNTEYKSVEGSLKVQNKNHQTIVVASNYEDDVMSLVSFGTGLGVFVLNM